MKLLYFVPRFTIRFTTMWISHGALWLLHCSTWGCWHWMSKELQHRWHGLCKYSTVMPVWLCLNVQCMHRSCLTYSLLSFLTLVGHRSTQAVHQAAYAPMVCCQMEPEAASLRAAVHVYTTDKSTSLERRWQWIAIPGLYISLQAYKDLYLNIQQQYIGYKKNLYTFPLK